MGQTRNTVRAARFALVEKIVVQLSIAIDLAAFFLSRKQEIGLPFVLKGRLAQGHPKPGIKPAGMDAEQATHHSHREPLLMLGNERVLRFAFLAKYAVAFLRNTLCIGGSS